MDAAVFRAIVEAGTDEEDVAGDVWSRGPDSLPAWASTLHSLISEPLGRSGAPGIDQLCEVVLRHARIRLREQLPASSRRWLRGAAAAALEEELLKTITSITRHSCRLCEHADLLARDALGLGAGAAGLRGSPAPAQQMAKLFIRFPVLARLCCEAITDWCDRTAELLRRLSIDERAIARAFFRRARLGELLGIETSLSDPHNGGRTVCILRFRCGRLVYKPRSGEAEWRWNLLLLTMNRRGFRPALRAVKLVRRSGYCWMEYVGHEPCHEMAEVRRFYQRAGALAAVAQLVRAVDCHRQNVIAAGEHPVLVDAEALLHPDTEGAISEVGRTGFFSDPDRSPALVSDTATLSPTSHGTHVPVLHGAHLMVGKFRADVLSGYAAGWHCLTGKHQDRRSWLRFTAAIARQGRRRIYRATRVYSEIREASLAPAMLRCGRERTQLLTERLANPRIPEAVREQELQALRRLDIPYFFEASQATIGAAEAYPPQHLMAAIEAALRSPPTDVRDNDSSVTSARADRCMAGSPQH